MATAVAAAALLAGCRTTPSGGAEPTTAPRPDVDEHPLTGDGGRSLDFDVRESPREVVATSPVVVTGTIASWERGVDAYDDEDAQRWAILAVDVDEAHVGAAGVQDGKVYVRVLRGYEVVGPDGNPIREPGARSSVLTVDELEQAAPPGVRIAVLEDESGDLVSGMVDDDPATWGPDWRPPGAKAAARGTAFDWLADQIDEAT